jgi:hypothetical protein
MGTKEKNEELIEKIIHGLDLAHKKLYEYKKRNHQELVILKDNKIVKVLFAAKLLSVAKNLAVMACHT